MDITSWSAAAQASVPPPVRTFRHNMSMALSEKQKKYLRRLAHPLDPIVMLGNAGLTDNIVKETDRALNDHELIKISARVGDRDARDAALSSLVGQTSSELVQRIGNVGVLYRRCSGLPKVVLPDH